MEFTDNLGLPCPSPQDYGALALYMQDLANLLEGKILEQRTEIEAAGDRKTAIWVNTSTIGPIASTDSTQFTFTTADLIFSNYSDARLTNNPGLTFYESGVYHLGYMANTTEVGAVTADSFRQVACFVQKSPGVTIDIITLHRRVAAEGIVGGSFFGNNGVFRIDEDFIQCGVKFELTHGNVASDVQIPVGGCRAWLTRLGSTEAIEVT